MFRSIVLSQAAMNAKRGVDTIWLNSQIKLLFRKKHVIEEKIGKCLEYILPRNLNNKQYRFL